LTYPKIKVVAYAVRMEKRTTPGSVKNQYNITLLS
jgi:hypothetical protein